MPLDRREFIALGATGLLSGSRFAFASEKDVPCMLKPSPSSGFGAVAMITTGDQLEGYYPPGIMDGMTAWDWSEETVRLFVNHELAADAGYPYALSNGLQLRGARVSWFDIDKRDRVIRSAGNAIGAIYDRRGDAVTDAEQINEHWGKGLDSGLNTLCSAQGFRSGELGFVDDVMFTNEEVSAEEDHPHGGSIWVLDIRRGELHAAPELGRGSWENVAAIATPDMDEADGHVALLLADDLEFGSAPLYLWIGRKVPGGGLLERNGLTQGTLYVWAAVDGHRSPEDWNGTGEIQDGRFVEMVTRDEKQAGRSGHDRDGYLDDILLREQARRAGGFMFSRPEDLDINPADPLQLVFCSTGQGRVYPSDDWGTVYRIDMRFEDGELDRPAARLTILHDGDDFGDYGIRNPDNVVWATDGMIYLQEDKATKLRPFGGQTGREASVWRLNPMQPDEYRLVAVIDRDVVLPLGARDTKKRELGAWESSGIIDVSEVFGATDELLLLTTVQAHSIRGGALGDRDDLVQGGQMLLMSKPLARG